MADLKDMSFDDLVKFGIEVELDAVVKGEALRASVWALMELAARWNYAKMSTQKNS